MDKALIKFIPGTKARAAEMNQNLEMLLEYCKELESRIVELENKELKQQLTTAQQRVQEREKENAALKAEHDELRIKLAEYENKYGLLKNLDDVIDEYPTLKQAIEGGE